MKCVDNIQEQHNRIMNTVIDMLQLLTMKMDRRDRPACFKSSIRWIKRNPLKIEPSNAVRVILGIVPNSSVYARVTEADASRSVLTRVRVYRCRRATSSPAPNVNKPR